ncbi:MAG: undecaprenyl-diphosphate phosphatase [Oscillospiraceae bacterium]|jgi:undecaprenyl-diphosphatase|nr:undecaprenyl-diphosphate phosphatase [Oscillospiraceae bacterium]
MDWLHALIAGIIQGVTEFLPVSSSGHLVVYNALFGGGGSNLVLTVFLHFATLLSVVIVFCKDIRMLIREFFSALLDLIKGKPNFKTPERRFLLMVIIATIPAAAVGLGIKMLRLDSILENIFTVAVMLTVTSVFMFLVDKLNKGKYTEADAPCSTSLLVGCLQAVAVLPGLSRSGSTIFGGLLGGFKKEFAIKFAFILSIPAILGAGTLELLDVVKEGSLGIAPSSLAVGFAAAAVFGVVAIKFINMLIKNNKFFIFGIYCLLASVFAFLVGFGVIHS